MVWKVGFLTHVAPKLAKQRDLLEEARLSTTDPEQLLSTWVTVFRRLPTFIRVGNESPRASQVPPISIADEKGLQDVMEAILRLHFDDVRREDHIQQVAGAASLVDFQLPDVGLFIEAKMTRKSLRDKGVGDELLVDAGRYPAHPSCKAILAVVYDPQHHVRNAPGLEKDLSQPTAGGYRCGASLWASGRVGSYSTRRDQGIASVTRDLLALATMRGQLGRDLIGIVALGNLDRGLRVRVVQTPDRDGSTATDIDHRQVAPDYTTRTTSQSSSFSHGSVERNASPRSVSWGAGHRSRAPLWRISRASCRRCGSTSRCTRFGRHQHHEELGTRMRRRGRRGPRRRL